ncbi:hypothetical protein Tco_1515575 [Tanacetum coccineum]
MDELIAHVSEKTYAYGAIRAENQNLLSIISELKARLETVEKAPGMYRVFTTQESQTNEAKSDLSSIRMNVASSVRRPMNKDSHVKNSVLANSKNSTKKVVVYVRKNKQTYNTSANVISNKENVNGVNVANAAKAKTLLCVSCMQNVLIPCHDKCLAKYKLNVHSNDRRALSTNSRTPTSSNTTYVVLKTRFSAKGTGGGMTNLKSLDTTSVVSKPKIAVGSTSKAKHKVVQIVLWIVDSGCSKHMTGDRSLLRNFIEKFIGIVRFRNDNFAAITGYGDYIQGNITICHLYYVEDLGHNLFSVGQFFDGDLEVAFRSKTSYVQNLEGDDLLTGGRESNLYTISISDMAASSPVCSMSKATSTKSWLWHWVETRRWVAVIDMLGAKGKLKGQDEGGFVDKFVRDANKTPDSSQRPPSNCPKCGNPIDGLYCQQCALLRKKLKEFWSIICYEDEIFQDFLNTSESSNDKTNVVNAPQEPFVFNQDPDENSSQRPPHIDHHCCYGCGYSLDGSRVSFPCKLDQSEALVTFPFADMMLSTWNLLLATSIGIYPLFFMQIRGDDEVELTDEESSDDEDDIAEVFRIDTNIFDYETPLCSAFKEFNYLLEVDPDLLTKDIIGFKTYEDYKDDWIYEWNKGDYEWYEALEDCKLKYEALRNKAIMEGSIKEDDDESHYEQKRQWNTYTNYDDAYEINHENNKSEELCEVHKQPMCNIRRYMMIKYSFNDDEEYVAVKEDEYNDLTVIRKEACQAYQEIFQIIDEG